MTHYRRHIGSTSRRHLAACPRRVLCHEIVPLCVASGLLILKESRKRVSAKVLLRYELGNVFIIYCCFTALRLSGGASSDFPSNRIGLRDRHMGSNDRAGCMCTEATTLSHQFSLIVLFSLELIVQHGRKGDWLGHYRSPPSDPWRTRYLATTTKSANHKDGHR